MTRLRPLFRACSLRLVNCTAVCRTSRDLDPLRLSQYQVYESQPHSTVDMATPSAKRLCTCTDLIQIQSEPCQSPYLLPWWPHKLYKIPSCNAHVILFDLLLPMWMLLSFPPVHGELHTWAGTVPGRPVPLGSNLAESFFDTCVDLFPWTPCHCSLSS